MKSKRRWGILATAVLLPALIISCGDSRKPVKGFVLPEGDVARGEQVFIAYNCQDCHTIRGEQVAQANFEAPFILDLGGKVYRVRDYGELMTSVVNPDHIISAKYLNKLKQEGRETGISPMPEFSQQMTVAELRDLVEYLHAQYSKMEPQYYRGYYLTK